MATGTEVIGNLAVWAVGVPSVGVLIAYGISIIRLRASADKKTVNEDKSYQDMLTAYRKERDDTREERDRVMARMVVVEAERNEAVGKVGKLTAEVEFLSQQVTELKTLVEKLGANLDAARIDMNRIAIENAKHLLQMA